MSEWVSEQETEKEGEFVCVHSASARDTVDERRKNSHKIKEGREKFHTATHSRVRPRLPSIHPTPVPACWALPHSFRLLYRHPRPRVPDPPLPSQTAPAPSSRPSPCMYHYAVARAAWYLKPGGGQSVNWPSPLPRR